MVIVVGYVVSRKTDQQLLANCVYPLFLFAFLFEGVFLRTAVRHTLLLFWRIMVMVVVV